RLATIAGYDLTIKTRAAYPNSQIDCDLDELEQYCCVIVMSSLSTTGSWITDTAAKAFADYRENGSGLIVITDHGPRLATLEAAQPTTAPQFFGTANKIITQFGAWFSGTYNRSPVNVGFLRRTYGDHPLYNGMTDDESISAGGSES